MSIMRDGAGLGYRPIPKKMGQPNPPEPIDPFFESTKDLKKSFKKSSKKTERRIAKDRSAFMSQLGTDEEDERLSERDLSLAGGQMRRRADANANEQVANISRRMGGDTSSAAFQLLATGARGGAAASTGAAMARFRLEDAQAQKDRSLDRARLMLGLRQVEQGDRGQNLQQQGFMRSIFESDRNFQNTIDQQETQKKMFAVEKGQGNAALWWLPTQSQVLSQIS